ncbi:hypothetical protein GX50_01330 [[Emmonsia] crescens]|uniref:Uncharacterized protein n=1 Tax=[Emmonsia] crescens TaxID=73230 RepID=A0A2B7ZS95_9EURO|nr:hypothetical protein GX50_01330 [Emmonsia crescens]
MAPGRINSSPPMMRQSGRHGDLEASRGGWGSRYLRVACRAASFFLYSVTSNSLSWSAQTLGALCRRRGVWISSGRPCLGVALRDALMVSRASGQNVEQGQRVVHGIIATKTTWGGFSSSDRSGE